MIGPSRPTFVLFGSSIVQMSFNVGGWGAILADLYSRKADIVLRGYGGWNSRNALEVLHQIFPQNAGCEPSLVIVYFGGNDAMQPHPSGLGPHVPLPEYLENMKKIALHLKSLSEKTRIIFLTPPPVDLEMIHQCFGNMFDKQPRTNESCGIYAKALVELGKQLNVKVVDLWTAFQHRDDWARAYLMDGIHLAPGGSRIVVKEILRVLKEAKWEPNLYWMLMPCEFSEDSPYYLVGPDDKTTTNFSCVISHWQTEWMDLRSSPSPLCEKYNPSNTMSCRNHMGSAATATIDTPKISGSCAVTATPKINGSCAANATSFAEEHRQSAST